MMNPIFFVMLEIVSAPLKADPLYLDPGSGSFLIQLLIASALGAALVFKTSWTRIKNFFKRGDAMDVDVDENQPEDE